MTRTFSPALACAALMLSCVIGAAAQPAGQAQQPSATTQGLSMDSDQPVRIESNTLEVRDKIRQATFAGDVKLTQGDTTIKCKVLVVFYEDTAAPSKKNAPPAPAAGQPAQKNSQKIKRAECKGDVFVVQKEQSASGETAVFDVKSNTVVITGSVVLTQGPTVTRGERLVSNLSTGITNIYSTPVATSGKGDPPKGRVEVLMQPGAKDVKATPVPAQPAPAAPPSAKAAPKGPLRLN
ncbi:MAG TPA: LptA/OstA family protein [Xanthobacteraceae bacterium]|nr:LptA/OstA family protein [Xanthobacteraceae bacterium]